MVVKGFHKSSCEIPGIINKDAKMQVFPHRYKRTMCFLSKVSEFFKLAS